MLPRAALGSNEYKKFAIPKIEAGKMVDVVRKTIKEVEYAKQDQYEDRKEIYKPITQELKKEIDEISHLREEFIKSANKPISFTPLEVQMGQEAIMPPEQQILNLDAGFTEDDLKILQKHGFTFTIKNI